MKRILVTIAVMATCLILAWLAGFNFDKRGVSAFFVTLYTLMIGGFVFAYPGWKE